MDINNFISQIFVSGAALDENIMRIFIFLLIFEAFCSLIASLFRGVRR